MVVRFHKCARLILFVILMLGLLTACGGRDNAAQSANTERPSEQSANQHNNGSQTSLGNQETSEPLKLQMMVPSYADVPNMDDEYWSEFQKRTHTDLNVEWVPSGDYNTKFDLVISSGNLPEIIVSTSTTRPTLQNAIKQGAFWDLTPFLGDFRNYPNLKNNSEANVWNYMKVDGNIYGIPRNRPHIDLGIKMRKDWLDKFNLEIPATLEEYAAALKTIVNGDPDGNGKNDTIGLLGHGFLVADGDGSFLAAFSGLDPVYDSDGGLMKEILTPNYTQMVEWFRHLYADGLMAKEFSAIKPTQAEELFSTGRAASYTRNIWRDYTFEQEIKKVQPEAEVITLPPMQGPGGVSVQLAVPFSGAFYISKKVPEEKVKQILDFFERTTTMEETDYNYYGIEGVHHTLADGQPQLTELGQIQVTANGTGAVFPLAYNNKMKVINPSAPKAYNDAKMAAVEVFSEVGKVNVFSIISSETWVNTWPKYESEWQAMVIKAIVGQITMDEYRDYVNRLTNNADIKQAFQEFARAYKEVFGD